MHTGKSQSFLVIIKDSSFVSVIELGLNALQIIKYGTLAVSRLVSNGFNPSPLLSLQYTLYTKSSV